MMSRDCGIYEACAINEHGEARQRVNLAVAEYPRFIKRPEETLILARKSAKIEVRISGTPFPEVKWYKDWLPIAESSRIKVCTDHYSFISKVLTKLQIYCSSSSLSPTQLSSKLEKPWPRTRVCILFALATSLVASPPPSLFTWRRARLPTSTQPTLVESLRR